MPSRYTISIDGEHLTCYLVKKREAASQELYSWIKRETGKDVYAVGVAAGQGAAAYPVGLRVIEVPMYHKGPFRTDGVAELWDACKEACSQKKAIVIHCNQSFHRGPLLMGAMMVKSGMLLSDAMECIGTERVIYGGHFFEHHLWPASERNGQHAEDFLEARRFVISFPPNSPRLAARKHSDLQPGATASSQEAPKQQQPVRQHKATPPKARSQTPTARSQQHPSSSQPGSTPPSPTGSHPQSIPAAACGSQPESLPAAASGLQPEPAAAIAEDKEQGTAICFACFGS
jgi:hypothetical protein